MTRLDGPGIEMLNLIRPTLLRHCILTVTYLPAIARLVSSMCCCAAAVPHSDKVLGETVDSRSGKDRPKGGKPPIQEVSSLKLRRCTRGAKSTQIGQRLFDLRVDFSMYVLKA